MKPGDIVRLLTGGPKMVVQFVAVTASDVLVARCVWWGEDHAMFQEFSFPVACLIMEEG